MNPNELLTWLSAKGSGTWSRYRAAVDELQVSDDTDLTDEDAVEDAPASGSLPVHLRLRLNLERLGHAEFLRRDFPNGWRIVPPTLACTTTETGVAGFLCGARTDQMLSRITGIAGDGCVAVDDQPECPDRIQISVDDGLQLRQLAEKAGLGFQEHAPRMLLAAIPPVDNWQQRSPAELPFGPGWEVHRFSADELKWVPVEADEARAASRGLFRFRNAYQWRYYLHFRRKSYAVTHQVGKYVLLRERRRHVVRYSADEHVFSMPVICRPPLLIDRALTLCTGLIPRVQGGILSYAGVPHDVAVTATALLRQ